MKVAYIGSGLIGAGLAVNAALKGHDVVLQTRKNVERAQSLFENGLQQFFNNGVITKEQMEAAKGHCTVTTSVEDAVKDADFIQESGPENIELKRGIIAQIEAYANADAVIASSTSGLSITEIFKEAKHPERGVGGHPYNPAHILPLVEVIKGEQTTEEFLQKARDFYQAIGKEPVTIYKESSGFIANRYQHAIHREAVDLVNRGICSVEDADKALVYSVGLRWGVIGQFLTLHLGVSPEGIGKFNEKYHIDPTQPDEDLLGLSTWTTFPENWCQMAQDGIDVEIAHRDEETGKDMASIEAWRDKMLIGMLRLHGKL